MGIPVRHLYNNQIGGCCSRNLFSPNHLFSPHCYTVFIVKLATRDDREIVQHFQRKKREYLPQISKIFALRIKCSNSIDGHAQPYERCAELEITCTKPDGADTPFVKPSTRLQKVSVIVTSQLLCFDFNSAHGSYSCPRIHC